MQLPQINIYYIFGANLFREKQIFGNIRRNTERFLLMNVLFRSTRTVDTVAYNQLGLFRCPHGHFYSTQKRGTERFGKGLMEYKAKTVIEAPLQ